MLEYYTNLSFNFLTQSDVGHFHLVNRLMKLRMRTKVVVRIQLFAQAVVIATLQKDSGSVVPCVSAGPMGNV